MLHTRDLIEIYPDFAWRPLASHNISLDVVRGALADFTKLDKMARDILASDDSDTEDIHQLTVNEHYAKAFEYRKEREELAKCM